MNRVKKIVSIVLILLLMVTSISAAVSFSSVDQSSQQVLRGSFEKKTWYVDDNGTADFTTVQEAVDAASPGDTIFVYSGLYIENIMVNKTLSLIGEDKNTTILDGNDTDDTMYISGDNVEITGFTIQRGGEDHWFHDRLIDLRGDHAHIHHNIFFDKKDSAICLEGSDDDLIEYNYFTKTGIGVDLYDTKNTIVANNTFIDEYLPIFFGSCCDCIARDNTIRGRGSTGIQFNGADGCEAYRNLIIDTGTAFFLVLLAEMNAIYENTIIDCNYGIWTDSYFHPIDAWSYAFHNNFINVTDVFIDYDGTYFNAPYPAGGNYYSDYESSDDYHGPNQDIPGGDGIYDKGHKGDHYPYTQRDGWKNQSIEPTLVALGGKDRVEYPLKPGEQLDCRFYVLNAGNTGTLHWRIEEKPEHGTWEFEQESGSVTRKDGLVRVNYTLTAPKERDTSYYGTIKIINEDNPDNYIILQADFATPIIHPFVLFMERMYDFFEEILDYFQVIIKNFRN